MAPIPTCYHVHGGNRCPNKRHKTSGNTIVKLCTLHYKRSRSKRAKPAKTDNKKDKDQKRANDATKKRNSRQRNKDKVTGIEDEQIRKLVQQLSVIKESVQHYLIIQDVIEKIEPKDIKRRGNKDPITFTDPKAPKTRSMQFVNKPDRYIPHILIALKQTFPGCKKVMVKIISSTANDPPQLTHTDFDLNLIHKRVSSLEHFHYSALIALENDTHLLIGIERKRVDIPIGSMLIFRGDMPHAGGGYKTANERLFISLSSAFYPATSDVFIVK